jgi:hypothetical protein
MSLVDLSEYYSYWKIANAWSMLGDQQATRAFKLHQETSDMSRNEIFDLVIERQGTTVTKVTKSGVVIWPQERHTAGMQVDTSQTLERAAKELGLNQFTRANDGMIGGNHYKSSDATGKCPHCKGPIEHWDWAHNLRALEYAATKYLARWRQKGGLDSLKKVIHYVQKLIEIHFPNVVVSISYSNRADQQPAENSGQYNPLQSAVNSDDQVVRRGEAQGCAGVAQGKTSYQTAVDERCRAETGNGRCVRYTGHEGPHMSPGSLDGM